MPAIRSRGAAVDFEVQVEQLQASAQAARSVAEMVGATHPGDDLSAGAAGMPGASAAALISQVAARFDIAVTQWWDRARCQAGALERAAENYGRAEQSTQQVISDVLAGGAGAVHPIVRAQ